MDKQSLAGNIDNLCTEFRAKFSDRNELNEVIFDDMIAKLETYAEITRDQEKIDRRVAKCLLQCYWDFQEYFAQYDNKHILFTKINTTDAKLNKILKKIVQNTGW